MLGFAVSSAPSMQNERFFHFSASIQTPVSHHRNTQAVSVIAMWCMWMAMERKRASYIQSQIV